jgi:hypothetical protein
MLESMSERFLIRKDDEGPALDHMSEVRTLPGTRGLTDCNFVQQG